MSIKQKFLNKCYAIYCVADNGYYDRTVENKLWYEYCNLYGQGHISR